jgi:type IV secretion system protein VirD4
MTISHRSRTDVRPVTWEVPVAGVAAWLLASLLILPFGRGAAAQLFGGGWVWPHGSSALMSSIGGLMTGHAGRGLTGPRTVLPPDTLSVYMLIGSGELLLVTATVWAAVLWWRLLGPGARQGMAGRGEVESVLGISRLRQARKVIRPDLYGTERRSRTGVSG